MSLARDVMVDNTLKRIEDVVGVTELAEREGYDRAWMGESWGRDAVTLVTLMCDATEDIGIGTSILPVYSRTPAMIGQTAATLQEVADGRMRIGLGPSGAAVIEHWHGVDFERPLRRTREYVEIVQAITRGEVVNYDGEFVEMGGFRIRSDPSSPVPVDVAALGPKMVELAGRFADGWHPIMLTPDGLEERLEALNRGAELGDRSAADRRVTAGVVCCVLEDADRAHSLARHHVAMYVGAMGTYYRDALADQGYPDVAAEVHETWQNGDQEAAVAAVSDELLDDVAVTGDPASAPDRLERFDVPRRRRGESAPAPHRIPRGHRGNRARSRTGELRPDRLD